MKSNDFSDLIKKYETNKISELEARVVGDDKEKLKRIIEEQNKYLEYMFSFGKVKYSYLKFVRDNFPNVDSNIKLIDNIEVERKLVFTSLYLSTQIIFFLISRRLLFRSKILNLISSSIMNFVLLYKSARKVDNYYLENRFDKELQFLFNRLSNEPTKRCYLDYKHKHTNKDEINKVIKKALNI